MEGSFKRDVPVVVSVGILFHIPGTTNKFALRLYLLAKPHFPEGNAVLEKEHKPEYLTLESWVQPSTSLCWLAAVI